MNTMFRRSASVAPAASRQILAALLRLIPSESFASSAISQLDRVNGSPPTKKGGAIEIRSRDFHLVTPTRSSGFMSSDTARVECAMDERFFDDEKTSSSTKKGEDEEGLVIAELYIHHKVVEVLEDRGITKLSPIQRACFEPVMEGRDMICLEKTGTWKNLVYGIPIMNKSLIHFDKYGLYGSVNALVLVPTRELAQHVEKDFSEYIIFDTYCANDDMTIQAQMKKLEYGADALFGTPGQIVDLINGGDLYLGDVQFVILDECDQMLTVGFEEALETILEKITTKYQCLVFSATMPQALNFFTRKYLKDPVTIDLVSMQSQAAGGGSPSYGFSCYGAPSYGYDASNNGLGSGGYSVGGYGGSNGGCGGPSCPYCNPSSPTGGYVSGPTGAPINHLNNQAPTGYGSSGYGGSAGYGSAPNWNALPGSGGSAATSTGQSPNAATGYGNQGYGYGGEYGEADGSNRYMRPHAAGGGYSSYGSSGYGAPSYGYGDANNGVGYGDYSVVGCGGSSSRYGGPFGPYGNASTPTDGSYGNQGGYGVVGGRGGGAPNSNRAGGAEHGALFGYMGSSGGGNGDVNGNSGYSSAWRSDRSHGGYGAGQVCGPLGDPLVWR